MAIDRLQRGDARELDRAVVFGRLLRRSDAVRTSSMSPSGLGMIWARYLIASRNVASLLHPPARSARQNVWTRTQRDSATEPGFKRMPTDSFRILPDRTIHERPCFVFSAGNLEGR